MGRRLIIVGALLLTLSLATVGIAGAAATWVDANPEFQNIPAGDQAEVFGSWGGTALYDVRMCWNDGLPSCEFRLDTTDTAGFFSYSYTPDCVNRTYYPVLRADTKSDQITATQQKSFCFGS